MHRYPITVLKFGSSVLCCEADLSKAVQEIYRWTRDGHRVVAVVSAIGSTTDALLARAQTYGSDLSDEAVATLVATGEATSAALLTLALERAGLHSVVVDEVRLGVRTRGPLLNAEPCGIDVPRVLSVLENAAVAVVPGFVGRQEDGTLSLLGRGGSDLTAVFVAHHLGAERCRLVKDVNGIFEHDPANTVNVPRRYSTVSWEQAVRVGNGVVQPRAIEFAEQHGLTIEVATLNSDSPTLICGLPISFADHFPSVTPLRVGLLGAGTVGLGVYRTLAAHPETFDIRRVAVRQLEREDGIPPALLTQDPWEVVSSDCDVIIELIGGLSPARELIEAALQSGKHVITANKLVVSRYGKQLRRVAEFAGVQLLYSAAVGGGVPMLEQVGRIAQSSGIRTLHGVVNGTTNFILDRLAEGLSREDALGEAQRLGFAEQDPTSDLDGSDAAHKLTLLAQTAFGAWLNPADIERTGIEQFDSETVLDASRSGRSVRLVASLSQDKFGLRARIAPQLFEHTHAFAQTINEENCLQIESESGDVVQVRGKGAGRWPTAVSVMADVCDIYRTQHAGVSEELLVAGEGFMKFASRLLTFNACPEDPFRPIATPIYQTATFEQEEADTFGRYDYSRSGNPTRTVLEDLLARLENADRAFCFSSGLAAISAAARLLSVGDEILAGDDLYGGTYRLFSRILDRTGVTVRYADACDIEKFAAQITPRTRLLYIETPTNPLLRIVDIRKLADLAHQHGALLCVDSSAMSPYLQNPLDLGADIVVHSATKYLCGHSDVTAGVVAVKRPELAEQIYFIQNGEGLALGPFDCYLLLRGVKTLKLRLDCQQANALKVANFLNAHPAVQRVHFPGLAGHPGHQLHVKQARGAGAVISFETGSFKLSKQVVEATQLFRISVSFGSVNSSISLPGCMSHASIPAEVREARSLATDLVRLSVGIEDVDDLIADLERAFERAGCTIAAANGAAEISERQVVERAC